MSECRYRLESDLCSFKPFCSAKKKLREPVYIGTIPCYGQCNEEEDCLDG